MELTYKIHEPEGGWPKIKDISDEEIEFLRPVAETLAMLDGNAFLSHMCPDLDDRDDQTLRPWYAQYLPEAKVLYENNGGRGGWAGIASFVPASVRRQGQIDSLLRIFKESKVESHSDGSDLIFTGTDYHEQEKRHWLIRAWFCEPIKGDDGKLIIHVPPESEFTIQRVDEKNAIREREREPEAPPSSEERDKNDQIIL